MILKVTNQILNLITAAVRVMKQMVIMMMVKMKKTIVTIMRKIVMKPIIKVIILKMVKKPV